MNQRILLITVIIVLVGTIFLINQQAPEYKEIKSDDGHITVSGTFVADQNISIETLSPIPFKSTSIVSPIYRFHPPDLLLQQPAMVSIDYTDFNLPSGSENFLRIGVFNDNLQMWQPLTTEVNGPLMVAQTKISGFVKEMSLLLLDDVALPNFDKEINNLISVAPDKAVGYEIEVGYATIPGDFVVIPGTALFGGCNGKYETGTDTTMTSVADIFDKELEYQIVAIWQLGEGCGALEQIE